MLLLRTLSHSSGRWHTKGATNAGQTSAAASAAPYTTQGSCLAYQGVSWVRDGSSTNASAAPCAARSSPWHALQNAGRKLCCCFCCARCRARIARRRASLACISLTRFAYSSGHLRFKPHCSASFLTQRHPNWAAHAHPNPC